VILRTALTQPVARTSLRAELLINLTLLSATSIVFAVAGVIMLADLIAGPRGAIYLTLILLLDLVVFVTFGTLQVQRHVIKPLREAMLAAEAIAGGDLERRVPLSGPLELHHLADSVNRMTDRLLDERAQLGRAEKLASVGRLAAGVAHEIGNPLGAINGYAHLLRNQAKGNARAIEAVTGLERESTRIDRIVRGLLDYARPRKPVSMTVDVNEAIRSVLELLSAQGALNGVKVSLDLDETGPRLVGDQHGLEQVLVNLMLNAGDALADAHARNPNRNGTTGSIAIYARRVPHASLGQPASRRVVPHGAATVLHPPPGRVKAWAARHRDEHVVKIVVADSGPGVDPENMERIFDPFFTTKEPGKGTGLGLAIVARIVDNLHGTVWVVPAREGGAAFHLLFPAAS
jgi:signal transduction histidine kinase